MNAPAPSAHLSTKDIQSLDSAHFIHPFTDHGDLATRGARVITKAEGIYIWDSEGEKMLDAMSGLWCVNVGYGRKELADAAYQQMMTLPFYNSFFQTTNVPAVKLAERLARLAPKVGDRSFQHVFYSSSGSESNDSNVRMVRRYWDLLGQPQRKLPYFFENGLPGESADAFGVRAAGWLEEKILQIGADKVAAFIAEPVQGAGGVIIPPATYWPEIQRIVDKYGILLISDEVICAFGRLGHWFAYEKFGYKPDLVTFAKAVTSGYIPLGGVMVGNRVADVLIQQGGEFNHGYTYSGHPVACAVALANLDLMEKENLPQRVKDDIGPYLAKGFEAIADHPLVGSAETCGFTAGLVLVKNKATRERFAAELSVGMVCRRHCFQNGLIMRAVGDRMIIAPPLVMTHAEIDELLRLIRNALDLTLQELKQKGLY